MVFVSLAWGYQTFGLVKVGAGGMRGHQVHGHTPAGGVCPAKRLRSCLLPDSVLLILQNPARAVIILIYDQVSVCVVTRVKVGDHAGGDPQAPHHCKEDRKSFGVVDSGDLWIPGVKALGAGKSFIWQLEDQAGAVWGPGLVTLPTFLPNFLSSSSRCALSTLCTKASVGSRANGKSSSSWVPLLGPAGQDRHASFGKTQWPDSASLFT